MTAAQAVEYPESVYSLFPRFNSLLHSFTFSLAHVSSVHCSLPLALSTALRDLNHGEHKFPPFSGCNRMNTQHLTVFYFARESAFCCISSADQPIWARQQILC